jgi:uncharacterized Zn finger protein
MTDSTLILRTLRHIPADRLQKATSGLAEGSMTIALTSVSEAEIRALVKNTEGKEYGVTLTAHGAYCSCPDALYRRAVCKHSGATALFALRRAEDPPAELHVGDRVRAASDPSRHGTLIAVSAGTVSVWWDHGRKAPCERAAVERVAA